MATPVGSLPTVTVFTTVLVAVLITLKNGNRTITVNGAGNLGLGGVVGQEASRIVEVGVLAAVDEDQGQTLFHVLHPHLQLLDGLREEAGQGRRRRRLDTGLDRVREPVREAGP